MQTDDQKAKYDLERVKTENAALRKYAAIQKAAEDKIGVQKVYVDITGDIEAAFVLDEIIFYTLPRQGGRSGLRVWKEGFLWMAVQRSEWWDRKRLTPRQADTAISKLQEQNLIFKDVYKFNGQTTVHLRLNSVEFFKRYSEELEKSNPPENDDDTLSKDINDLYKMMGIPESQIRDSQNGETESPFRETELQNGDSINIPDSSQTQPNSADAGAGKHEFDILDGILEAERLAILNVDKAWRGRELLPEYLLVYGDWWHSKTKLHFYGKNSKPKMDKGAFKAFNEWYEDDLTISALSQSYDIDIAWKKIISKPAEITAKAKAIQANGAPLDRPKDANAPVVTRTPQPIRLDEHGGIISY